MPSVLVCDENEGRRNLLAGALEKLEYEATRISTLRQAEGTTLAAVPDVLVLDQTWTAGSLLDTCQRVKSDPKVDINTRIVILSSDTSDEYLIACTKAGVDEVIAKPLDLNDFVTRTGVHAAKQFVPPPYDLAHAGGGSSKAQAAFFDTAVTELDPMWALPMFKELVGPERVTDEFARQLLGELQAAEVDVAGLDEWTVQQVVLTAFDHLIEDANIELQVDQNPAALEGELEEASDEGLSRLERVLDSQMRRLEAEVEEHIGVLDEESPLEEEAPLDERTGRLLVAPESIELVRGVLELAVDLFWDLGQPEAIDDPVLAGRSIELGQMSEEALEALPQLTPAVRRMLRERQGQLTPRKVVSTTISGQLRPKEEQRKIGW